jgi:hypothetical protein
VGLGALIVAIIFVFHSRNHPPVVASKPTARHHLHPSGKQASGSHLRPHSQHQSAPPKTKPPSKPSVASHPHHHLKVPPTTPATIRPGWSVKTVNYHGAEISVTLPRSLTERAIVASSTTWRWENTGNSAYRVVVSALPASFTPPSSANHLGPGAYGTAITSQAGSRSQTLFVDWPAHAWISVSMTVPSPDISWLGTIARSVRIG